jgi:RNA polymerase sigma factor (sigma-70 family)
MANGQLSKAIRQLRRLLGVSGTSDPSDRQLLERFVALRDEEAFTVLVERYGPLVWGVCRRILVNDADAEDAFQAAFWVLARKAQAIQWHESIGNWLYGVACRTAWKVRSKADLRRRHEQQAALMNSSPAEENTSWPELRCVLDEELGRLPARYRMPLLLCYLHGKSRDEAAQELGWSVGTVKGCLERGRELLRSRLTQRGLVLTTALLPTVLANGIVTAAPPTLVNATVNMVAAGTVPAAVQALSQEVLTAMIWSKWKMTVAVLVFMSVIGTGTGMWVWQARAGTEQPNQPPAVLMPVPVQEAKDQAQALALAAQDDLPAIAQADRAVVRWLFGDRPKQVTIADPHALKKIRSLLIVKEIPPSAGENYLQISFWKGDVALRQIWAYQNGEWGIVRPKAPHWTLGTNPELIAALEELAKTAEAKPATKTSAPAVKNGLSITVAPAKILFAPGEPLEFKVSYTNVGTAAFSLKDADYLWNREVRFEEVKTRLSWSLRPLFRCSTDNAVTVLEPGKTFEASLVLSPASKSYPHVFFSPGDRFERQQARLNLGSYRVTFGVEFADTSKAAEGAPRRWTGQITSRPAEFEIDEIKPVEEKNGASIKR